MNFKGIAFCAAAAGALAALALGCTSPHAVETDSRAAIIITNQPALEIARAVSEVFKAAGFTAVPLPANAASRNEYRLIFERQAGAGDTLLYGDWSLQRNWHRAKVRVKRREQRTCLVTCDAFRVMNRGDAHFEDEKRLSRGGHKQYQKLLEEAAAKLPPVPIERAPAFDSPR